jgi:hypothetical protein
MAPIVQRVATHTVGSLLHHHLHLLQAVHPPEAGEGWKLTKATASYVLAIGREGNEEHLIELKQHVVVVAGIVLAWISQKKMVLEYLSWIQQCTLFENLWDVVLVVRYEKSIERDCN